MNGFVKHAGKHADLLAAGAVVLVVVMMIIPLPRSCSISRSR
jgi:hypothetical protein